MTRRMAYGILLARLVLLISLVTVVGCGSGGTSTSSGTSTSGASTTSGSSTTSGTSTGGTTSSATSGSSTGGMPDGGCMCPAPQHCDPLGSNQCLDCLTDADCQAPKGVCQDSASILDYGKCVGCTPSKPTCPSGQVCDLSLGPTYLQCLADCRLDGGVATCPPVLSSPQHCDSVTGTCAPRCLSDSDCFDGLPPHCDLDGGACLECLAPSDCPFSYPGCQYGSCNNCSVDADCPTGLKCSGSPGMSGFCYCTGAGCGGDAPVCVSVWYVPDGGLCSCMSSTDCSSGLVCSRTRRGMVPSCVPSCVDGGVDCTQFTGSLGFNGCNPDTGICGPCLSDDECVGISAGPRCRGSLCGCYANPDCAPQGYCGTNGSCQPSCALDGGTDCSPLGLFCDLDSGACGPCTADTQCVGNDAGPRCLAGAGTCGCQSSTDCGASAVCNPSSGCVLRCDLDGGPGCPTFQYCDSSTGLCGPCTAQSQCAGEGSGNQCLPQGYCGCVGTADCSSGKACDPRSMRCVAGCTEDGGTSCASLGEVCDPVSDLCVACLTDLDCQGAGYCSADVDAGHFCVQCVKPSQCPAGSGCDSSYFQCGSCSLPTDCPADTPVCEGVCLASCVLSDGGTSCSYGVCDTVTGVCVVCLTDQDCTDPSAPYCASDVDAGNYCVACYSPDQCASTAPGCNSASGVCGSCYVSTDCPALEPVCQVGACGLSCALDGGTDCSQLSLYCDPVTGACGVCTTDGQCTGNTTGSRCLAYGGCGCQAATDCPSTSASACDPSVGQCLPSCAVDGGTDCSATSTFCNVDSGVCGPCTIDSECTQNASGSRCFFGVCGCYTSSDCDAGVVCSSTNYCLPSCAVDGGTDCSAFSELCDLDSGLCLPCSSDDQCTGNDAGPRCLSYGNCGCLGAQDCGPTGVCNSYSLACGSCGQDSDCPASAPTCDSNGNCGP
jgi:hypothetical protein